MKQLLLFIILFLIILSPNIYGAIGNQGLIINGGTEVITLEKGEKVWLRVRDRRTNLPVLKDVDFFSDNDIIASIDEESGLLQGNAIGSTRITVMHSNGNGAMVLVKVIPSKKLSPLSILIFLPCVTGIFFLWRWLEK